MIKIDKVSLMLQSNPQKLQHHFTHFVIFLAQYLLKITLFKHGMAAAIFLGMTQHVRKRVWQVSVHAG